MKIQAFIAMRFCVSYKQSKKLRSAEENMTVSEVMKTSQHDKLTLEK